MAPFNKYLASLASCRKLAKQEYDFVTYAFRDCDDSVQRLEHSYATVINRIPKSGNQEARAGLSQLREDLKSNYASKRGERSDNLRAKAEQHRFFNVMLFGRTMAGKSTLREALTGGDGASIGKGAQRTTLDVKEYEWNGLRIVDTPGFGAVEGAQDTEKARKTLERIDLVLFLLNSDSIQDTTFRELEYIAERNTPLIFVLNMKRNLENDGNRRRALKSPEKVIYKPDEITGHEERLRFLAAQAGLNPRLVRVIPIHAQAAFMSTQATGVEAEELRELGRLDCLLATICQDVETNGPIRRIQSFLDSALLHVTQQLALFIGQRDQLGALKLECTSGSERISTWRMQLTSASPKKVSAAVDHIYKKLEDSIPEFVEDNVESGDVAEKWKAHVKPLQIENSIESAAQALADEVKQGLQDLSSEINESLNFAASLDVGAEMKGFDEWDYKRIHSWGSAISGGLSAIAISMSWNVIGWVAGGLALAFSVFSHFSDNKSDKLSAAKLKMEPELRRVVEKAKNETKAALATWIRDKLLDGVVAASEAGLNTIAGAIQEFEDGLVDAQRHLDEVQTTINMRLLQRVASIMTGRNNSLPPALRLVRTPGYASYLLTKESFRDIELLKQMGAVLNERIEVIRDAPKQEVLSYLFRGLVQRVELRSAKEATLHAAAADIGKIKGNGRRRIRLAAALTACELRTQTIKETAHA